MPKFWVVRVEEIDRELKIIVVGDHECKESELKEELSDDSLPYKSGDQVYRIEEVATLLFPRNVDLLSPITESK